MLLVVNRDRPISDLVSRDHLARVGFGGTMYKLKQFKEIKSLLLIEWQNEEMTTAAAYCYFKTNIDHNIIYEAGSRFEKYESEQGATRERLSNVYGLPYVSAGSEFAGLWNTNTQARAKYGEAIYFRAIAKAENGQFVLVFEDKSNQYYYFYEWEFLHYQEQERAKNKAREWCDFIKKCNIIKNATIDILKKYTGKKYGEKTSQAIAKEVNSKAREILQKEYNAGAWLVVSSGTLQYLRVSAGANYDNCFYFKFIDANNTIITPYEQVGDSLKDDMEYNGIKEFDKAAKLAEKLNKKAAELLPLLEEFGSITTHINATNAKNVEMNCYREIVKIARSADFWRW